MFTDHEHRILSYHDTWISIDPIQGCPYKCEYCVLRHAGNTGMRPRQIISPKECVERLLNYPLFVKDKTFLAIGNETDMLHNLNVDYLISLLTEISAINILNPIALITKAPLSDKILQRIREIPDLTVVLFLSYSGLGQTYEPNFTDQQFRANFNIAKANGFPIVHYWRPLLPDNSSPMAIREMLSFVSRVADATVFIGLKLHPELTPIITQGGTVQVPNRLLDEFGEWLEPEIIKRVYDEAKSICPFYPLYRHTSCALAYVLSRPNHTATVYREDVCPPSQCPLEQRQICINSRHIPTEAEIAQTISVLRHNYKFVRRDDRVVVNGEFSQEEFTFMLHNLNCPLEVDAIKMYNLYHGDIYKNQKLVE